MITKIGETSTKKEKNWQDYTPMKSYVVTPSVKEYLESLLSDFNKDDKRFVYNLIARSCATFMRPFAGEINMYCRWVEKHFPKVQRELLESAQIIDIDHRYSKEKKQSKKYQVNFNILYKIDELIYQDLLNGRYERFDLMKNNAAPNALVSTTFDEDRNKVSDIVAARIKGYKPCKFNWRSIVDLIIQEREQYLEAKVKYGDRSPEFEKLYSRYRNDLRNFKAIMIDCGAVHIGGDEWIYMAPYKAQKSGRLTHMLGGFQSASRQFTAAAFMGQLNYSNYDMESAQPSTMAQLLDSLGLDSSFIKNEILIPERKKALFERCGVSKQTGKDYLIALLIGSPIVHNNDKAFGRFETVARLNNEWKEARRTGNYYKIQVNYCTGDSYNQLIKKVKPPATISHLLKEFNNNPDLAYKSFLKIDREFRPLIKEIEKCRELLIRLIRPKTEADHALEKPKWLIKHKGNTYIKNQCGCLLQIDNLLHSELIGKVIAHLLQGMEAAFMSYIVQLGEKYNYKPVQDYHDGAIIEGVVPQEAVDEAVLLSGVNGQLEIKPFEYPFNKERKTSQRLLMRDFGSSEENNELDNDEAAFIELLDEEIIEVKREVKITVKDLLKRKTESLTVPSVKAPTALRDMLRRAKNKKVVTQLCQI
jgi:hypothetical protein